VTALRCAGSSVYSASSDKTVVCWDAATRSPLYVQSDHTSYVKALLLCKWQLWSLSKDTLHVTVADGVFNGLNQQLELSHIQCNSLSNAVASQKGQIEQLLQQIQESNTPANHFDRTCLPFLLLFITFTYTGHQP
jgi:WD40 repeat protein